MKNLNFYKSIILNAPIGYAYRKIILDDKGIPSDAEYIEVNPTYEKIMGITENIIGKKMTQALPGIEKDKFNWIQSYGKVALNNEIEEFNQFSDVLNKWFKVNVYSDKPGYFITLLSDITQEVLSEKILGVKARELESFFNFIPDLVAINDQKGRIIKTNQAWSQILGYTEDEISSIDYIKIIHPDQLPLLEKLGSELRTKKDKVEYTIKLLHKDGNYRYISFKTKYHYGLLYTIGRDITENIEKENKIIYLSYHDTLTGLYNRAFFEEELKRLDTQRNLPLSIIMGDKIIRKGHRRTAE